MPADTEDTCRVALSFTQEEADCLLHLLMLAEPSEEICPATIDRLLCRIADAQRALNRQKLAPAESPLRAEAFA